MSTRDGDADAERFIAALLDRHAAPLRRPEFLKAIRALSARYVERRATLADRSPLDSAGKRAAFAAYYAPLHYLAVRHVVQALGPPPAGRPPLTRIVDLGCGTGVAGAAWAGARGGSDEGQTGVRPGSDGGQTMIHGIDRNAWAVAEAAWTYRALGLAGRATRGDLVSAAQSLAQDKRRLDRTGVILAWSSNELEAPARQQLLAALLELSRSGTSILVVEPISRRAAPWFGDWAAVLTKAGGREDDWTFDEPRPALLSRLDADVGFDRTALTARSLAINLP